MTCSRLSSIVRRTPRGLERPMHILCGELTWRAVNTCIYADLVPLNELAPNPHIYLLSPAHLQIGLGGSIPDYLRLSLVCMTLSHRINRTRGYHDPHCVHLVKNFYQYRGILIRSLGEDISVEHKRTSDAVIAGIMTLLLIDVGR